MFLWKNLEIIRRYIYDITNKLNPKGIAVDAYGETYSLPNDKSTFEDFINYIVGHGDDAVGKVSEGGKNANLLDDTGKFIDDTLENNYQAYIKRKKVKDKYLRID